MIQTTDLSYQYPKSQAIHFPDFHVEAGQSLLVRGESGCGKTTLLHLLAGLRRVSAGQIVIDGKVFSAMTPAEVDRFRGQYIGMVYQQPHFIESLSVLENLRLSPYAGKREKASMMAERLQIGELLTRYPNQLSVGQQQRASIARAFMNEPKLILADEPTSALDNTNCSKVVRLLHEEAVRNRSALIIVTHDDRLKGETANCLELNTLEY